VPLDMDQRAESVSGTAVDERLDHIYVLHDGRGYRLQKTMVPRRLPLLAVSERETPSSPAAAGAEGCRVRIGRAAPHRT
ncbi:MAG: hypothetical protein M3083_04575, partial [Actinomycetota bacterium]|nr:hypothetical protein [Actinomycetota bacterium]